MDRIPGSAVRWQSLDDAQLLTAVRAARLVLELDQQLATRLEEAAERLEFAALLPTTMTELLRAQQDDLHLVEELIREATEREPGFVELRIDPARFSPFFVGGPLGDLEANIEVLHQARQAAGTLLVELGQAA